MAAPKRLSPAQIINRLRKAEEAESGTDHQPATQGGPGERQDDQRGVPRAGGERANVLPMAAGVRGE